MFGTIGRMKVKPGKIDEINKIMAQDDREIDGHIAHYVYKLEGKENEFMIAVVFRDKESYFANADSPEQDDAYRKMVALLEGPPTFEDGEIVANG
ncbi:MAG: antibiotic biosynthesis monooxygenase [Actinomycetota bacterium]